MPGCQGVAKRGATVKGILDRLLLQHNPDALLAISENGEILHWNVGAEAIFGYSCGEALGGLLNDLIVPPDRRDEERRIREDALRHGLAVYESVRQRKDGLLLHVSVTTKAIRDAGGNLECFLSTKKDVTHYIDGNDRTRPATPACARRGEIAVPAHRAAAVAEGS